MTAQAPAEQITALLAELHDEVRTAETIPRYRAVRRGRRNVAILDFIVHRTRAPGLLAQARAAIVPGGSPGWDEDGALSPIGGRGGFESAEPVTEAFHLPGEIRDALAELGRELHAQGWRPPATLIDIALADEHAGARIAARLRALVGHARIVLGYDAPIVPLRDVYCPDCGGALNVRADASSAVWCIGRVPLHGPAVEGGPWPIGWVPCGARWPRGWWVKLLEEATAGEKMAG